MSKEIPSVRKANLPRAWVEIFGSGTAGLATLSQVDRVIQAFQFNESMQTKVSMSVFLACLALTTVGLAGFGTREVKRWLRAE